MNGLKSFGFYPTSGAARRNCTGVIYQPHVCRYRPNTGIVSFRSQLRGLWSNAAVCAGFLTCALWMRHSFFVPLSWLALDRTRTGDERFSDRPLYQLSYKGIYPGEGTMTSAGVEGKEKRRCSGWFPHYYFTPITIQ